MDELEAAWRALEAAAAHDVPIAGLFAAEPDRMARMVVEAAGLRLDLSKQPWTDAGLTAALALAEAAGVEARRAVMFAGGPVNVSEHRAALHPALRAPHGSMFAALGEPVSSGVEAGRARMADFAEAVRSGALRGATGERFTAVLHIGIGGSDLGPRLVWEALRPLDPAIEVRFAANVDGSEIALATAGLDPASTLVIVVSKTFATLETLANAEAARAWLRAALGDEVGAHLVAVSANPAAAEAFGVAPERVFAFWDWVGGRYSVWSAVGLSCAIGLGWPAFQRFLDGAAEMDAHFVSAPLARNAPVLLALAHIYNRNALGRPARAVVPYAQRLRLLPAYLQQLEMESNGKRVDAHGAPVGRATAGVVFGDAGTNGQHAFFQLLHQGTDVVPVDFVAVAHNDEGPPGANARLLANAVAQAEALMIGSAAAEGEPHRAFPGDRPSSFLLLDRLTPERLGALLALYEHKTTVEGFIWKINSFDQWGVELGKVLAARILGELEGGDRLAHDPSTAALIDQLRR